MCSNDKMTSRCFPSQHSNPFYSTVVSVSSIFGRRGSSASVLTERRSSYQYGGQQCSNVSAPPNNNKLAKNVHFCIPTNEYKTTTTTTNNHLVARMSVQTETEVNVLDDTLNNFEVQTVLYMEEPKSPKNILPHCKCTEV